MAKNETVASGRTELSRLKFQPAFAQLSASSPTSLERRDLASRRAIVRRVHSEFLEMPGLTLSIAQATRLFGMPPEVCARVFGELIERRMMHVAASGRYALMKRGY